MKEIKFRGIEKREKDWVYGYYMKKGIKHCICPDINGTNDYWTEHEVIPKTVGQYTGSIDITGQKIYEGDITPDGIVVFENGGFQIKDKHGYFEWLNEESREIIGNKYDNPEFKKGGRE